MPFFTLAQEMGSKWSGPLYYGLLRESGGIYCEEEDKSGREKRKGTGLRG